jgi:hypothetical protein
VLAPLLAALVVTGWARVLAGMVVLLLAGAEYVHRGWLAQRSSNAGRAFWGREPSPYPSALRVGWVWIGMVAAACVGLFWVVSGLTQAL